MYLYDIIRNKLKLTINRRLPMETNEQLEITQNENEQEVIIEQKNSISKEANIYLMGIIDNSNNFLEQLRTNEEADIINIYINSFGGEWDKVLEYVNFINELKKKNTKIISIITGYCCSASILIPLISDYVIMRELSQIMIHKPFLYITYAEKLDDTKIISINNELKNIWNSILSLISKKCGEENAKIISERIKNEQDVWLNCNEALKLNFVDEIEILTISNYNNFITPTPITINNKMEDKNENIKMHVEKGNNENEIVIKPIVSETFLLEDKTIKQFYKKFNTIL